MSRRFVPATFRALRHRNFRLWFFGQGLSLVGTWMQTMAQQVLVYRLTGSAVALGVVNFVAVIPLVPFALWGGSISDRLPKRTVLLVTQTIMLVQALVLGVLVSTGTVQPWHVYVMSFLLGAVKAVDMPPRQSFVEDMVEGTEDLGNAIGLNSAIVNCARMLGPSLAGVAVAVMGEALAFFVNALSFVPVMVGLCLMRGLPPPNSQKRSAGLAADTAEGIRFLVKERTLLILLSLIAASSFLSMPFNTLMPFFADSVLKESAQPLVTLLCGGEKPWMQCQVPEALPLGILLTAFGLGSIVGALLVASLPARVRRGPILTFGNLCFSLFLLVFAASQSMALSVALMVLVGISYVLQTTLVVTLLQTLSPAYVRGRVMSLLFVATQGMTNLGGLQAGVVADRIGAPLAIGTSAMLALVYGLWVAIRYRQVRQLP